MKKYILLVGFALASQFSQAQTLKDLLKEADKVLNGKNNTSSGQQNQGGILGGLGANLSNTEVVGGLKEALKISAQNSSKKLNVANGFFGNQLIKILMPKEVSKIESTLRQFGFNKQCDKLILSLNRAAEDASGKAVPIFINAITSMNINDGLTILRGGNNAATNFLKQATTAALTQAFRPVIEQSLAKVNAPALWQSVFATYNKLPISRQKVNTDLTGYVTERALAGLFTTVAQEEANIRTNPSAQVTGLLKKVFGN
jgi:hypothetical protein